MHASVAGDDFPDALLPVQVASSPQASPLCRLARALLLDVFTVKQFRLKYPHNQRWRHYYEADREWLIISLPHH